MNTSKQIILIANQTTARKCQPAIDEAMTYIKRLTPNAEIKVVETHYDNVLTEDYKDTAGRVTGKAVNRNYLKGRTDFYKERYPEAKTFIYLYPEFEVDRIIGYFNIRISTKEKKIIQLFVDPKRRAKKHGFKYELARVLVHEYRHLISYLWGVVDVTHVMDYDGRVEEHIEWLIERKPKDEKKLRISLLKKLLGLYQEVLKLMQAEVETYGEEPLPPLKNWDNLKRGYTFGVKTHYNDFHLGLDLSVPTGTPIYAPLDGVVQERNLPQGGITIWFEPENENTFIRFLHLSEVRKTGYVKRGEIIGYTGNTGMSTGSHLHVDVSKNELDLSNRDNFIDPEIYFG